MCCIASLASASLFIADHPKVWDTRAIAQCAITCLQHKAQLHFRRGQYEDAQALFAEALSRMVRPGVVRVHRYTSAHSAHMCAFVSYRIVSYRIVRDGSTEATWWRRGIVPHAPWSHVSGASSIVGCCYAAKAADLCGRACVHGWTQYLENVPAAHAHVVAALQWRERRLGPEHKLTVNAASNLACVVSSVPCKACALVTAG